jgi:outer membrane protein assembly factor BamB
MLFRISAISLIFLTAPLAAEEWPKWRGPRADGTWKAPKLAEKFPAGGPPVLWRRPIGGGYAGIVTSAGRVFTMDRPKPTEKGAQPDGTERVLCLDGKTGAILWTHEYPATYGDLDYGNGPRAAPTVEGNDVYTLGAVGMACCLDAATGKVRWQRDTVAELGSKVPQWGFAASPFVHGSVVIFHIGAEPNGSLVALDRQTGKEVWRSIPDPAGYCTPILVERQSGPQLVVWTPLNVRAVDPGTGKLLWTIPYEVTYGVSIATPIALRDIVLVAGYWEGSKAIKLGDTPEAAELLWEENRFLRGLMAPPLERDGLVYLLDKQYGITCFELATGKKLWDDANDMTPRGRNPQATTVWIDDKDRVLALNSEGELILARFSREGYQEASRVKIIGPTWANPGFAGKTVFARSDEEIVAVDLPVAE